MEGGRERWGVSKEKRMMAIRERERKGENEREREREREWVAGDF